MDCASDIITILKGRGVQLNAVGHQLEVNAPHDAIDGAMRSAIRKHKLDIIDRLLHDSVMRLDPFPVSNVQNRMNLGTKMSRPEDHVRSMHRFTGAIDKDTMSNAVQVLIQRNPTLLMRFEESGGKILQHPKAFGLFQVDTIEKEEGETSEAAARRYVHIPFDMSKDLLIRVGITSGMETETRHLVSVVHHALADGHSNALITKNLSEIYNQIDGGKVPEIQDSALAMKIYRDYCISSSSPPEDVIAKKIHELGEDLEGAFPVCDESDELKKGSDFQLRNIVFPKSLRRKLDALSKNHSINMLSSSLTAAHILLKKTHSDEHGAIGVPISNRFKESSLELISNMTLELPVTLEINDSDQFMTVMKTTQRDIFQKIDEPNCPLESLIDRGILPARGNRRLRMPFSVGVYEFKSGLQLTNTTTIREFDSHENPFLGMALRILHDEDMMELEYEYDRNMVSDERASALANAYLMILEKTCDDPTQTVGSIQMPSEIKEGSRLRTYRNANSPACGSKNHADQDAPNMTESILATHWVKVLKIDRVSRNDRFFQLGGSSLQVIQLMDSAGDSMGRPITLNDFIGDPTLAELTQLLIKDSRSLTIPPTMQIIPEAHGPKCFCIPGQGGISTFTFRRIARNMQSKTKLIGLQVPGIDPDSAQLDSIVEIARHMVDEIDQERDPGDPVMIMGHSAGGIIAMEIVKIFESRNIHCLPPILIGTAAPVANAKKGLKERLQAHHRRRKMLKGARRNSKSLELMAKDSYQGSVESRIKASVDRLSLIIARFNPTEQYHSDILLINDNGTRFCSSDENTRRWSDLTSGNVEMTFIDCGHLELVTLGEEKIQFHMEELLASSVIL